MLAAIFKGNEEIEIVDKEMPVAGPDDVLIKVSYCGLCGSDKRLFYQGSAIVPGHEISGVIVQSGANVSLKAGTKAIIYIPLFCGKCVECRTGNNNRCPNINGLVGWQLPGGYEEYLVVPARNVIPLPPDISLDEGVLLLDTIGTPAHGIRLCSKCVGHPATGKAAIIGCGPLGLGSMLVLQAMGCQEIYAYDVAEDRLGLAISLGARPLPLPAQNQEATFPLIIEATGNERGRQLALDLVKAGGAVLLLGESNNPWIIKPSPKLRRKDCFYIRSFYFPLNEVDDNFKIFREKRDSFKKLISKVGSLLDIETMHKEFCAGKTIKPLIKLETVMHEVK
ncbi:GroES (chaperonin 10)-like [Moorella glycerini]|uniref:Galactitol-1-phosphate 5-dehydrogenase n=1 Tax=Neomoorella stamsii TaxID=1266720 RepID=A0A9X7J616_9FIRM|nr:MULTISPECIES: alcohol dehydrogenase catalytic domain-containing protein [Moorella]PRR77546.1 Galactitol-1-phosphate 5-dehydrogenase [Moorella stamsii]CEP69407.1 GroES (chaperonin 10)-like [Moorella glycerini]